ncbi:aminomethyl-transferring glycine dehydrogenase [Salibacter sp.]|uniref:aminomethyl-transferring glycine dehydrogenase n=1 Tax=Salibacter sp. TaxID=2010995 RepID=UPI0028707D02|nr:aminomethyl-transferring glycine dehydrogenase [Salibacter sp.]MDR9488078.1 aminomethyl-transferring glycine dehydrogenase [Salibacter sp.]
MKWSSFERRHIGSSEQDVQEMIEAIGCNSLDELVDRTVPEQIRMQKPLDISKAMTEFEFTNHINELGQKNRQMKNFIGQGYYGTITPAVIQRNILENPGWYTAYTPYQAEIAQGRLEALLNFQTMVMDMTNMEIANASLLDEATAAAEAMIMFYNTRSRQAQKAGVKKFFIDKDVFEQTKEVLKTRATPLGIELETGSFEDVVLDNTYFGALLQYPTATGRVVDYSSFIEKAHTNDIKVCMAADIMSLALLKSPGSMNADCAVGSTQRFGIPMGYGGPHAAYFATHEKYKRHIPGRIIGVSKDKDGHPAFRMALQTREQHIRRDKATSNICTAQALLAVMAGFYAVYHGSDGIIDIAQTIHDKAQSVRNTLEKAGIEIVNKTHFDTLTVRADQSQMAKVKAEMEKAGFNLYYGENTISISLDETKTWENAEKMSEVLVSTLAGSDQKFDRADQVKVPKEFERTTSFLNHDIFNMYHSETQIMRYMKKLENRDVSLTHSMISLGSCTMKLNAASELYPISNQNFANVHPFAPVDQTQGYKEIIDELGKDLSEITGFDSVSFQPNSGAQGEYAGLMVIKAYHESNNDHQRHVCLIPSSAHGTNPASAVMAGMKVVVVKCDDNGNIDVEDLKEKAEKYSDELSALMVTYPSTHGVFEEKIKEIIDIIHAHGGQVYMDGANMNAQVGLTSPGLIGADVCHLNLHKTFAIPHGGGGPGMGPIGVAKHLTPFLPTHPLHKTGGENGITSISAAPYGSALILLISYGYIKMLGQRGLTKSSKMAILNANYIRAQLKDHYDVLYVGTNNTVAHEMIIDCRNFKRTANIEVEDMAKRLIDYGFHSPTVSFPVAGTMMIEPTESEDKDEIDRFITAMRQIREEIKLIEEGEADKKENVLKNAPHTARMIATSEWDKPYSREKAAYPVPYLLDAKFWSYSRRIDNAYGDRNLMCSCLPIEEYQAV